MFGVPLLLILFKEPLTKKIQKRADKMEESKAMFLVQGFFELFETLLSYFSNTLSFVRIGAFAVSHAAMMEVVLMLAGAEEGNPNWIVIILGNLFVCGMEGLIVGIQVLRLEYYEMFSRFYKGSGRKFEPYNKNRKNGKIKEDFIMTLAARIALIAALILSIIIPFGYYLIGEKNKGRYKRAIGVNVFFFFGAFVLASIMMFAGPNVQAADAAASASTATGMGYIAAALVTGLSCIGGGIACKCSERGTWRDQRGLQRPW